MFDLEAYKKEKNLCSQDVVNTVSKLYKKFADRWNWRPAIT